MEVKDNPLVFSGATKDWSVFKDAIQLLADKHDTTWLFEGGRALAEFFARQLKEKTGSKAMRAKAIEREIAKKDSNHVPTSVDAYTDAALKDWFEDTDIATGLLLSLNKNRLTSLGSNLGVWLGNDLSTPMFWMYSFKLRKVVRLSDPRHFDHILPFLCPEDIPHRIDLSADDICTMHEEDGDTVQRMPLRKSTRFRITASGEPVLVTPDSGALDADSGENSGELDTGEPDTAEQDKESPSIAQHKVLLGPKDYKRLKHGKDAPFDAELQYLKPQLLAQALVHHKFIMDLPDGIWIDEKTGKTAA